MPKEDGTPTPEEVVKGQGYPGIWNTPGSRGAPAPTFEPKPAPTPTETPVPEPVVDPALEA